MRRLRASTILLVIILILTGCVFETHVGPLYFSGEFDPQIRPTQEVFETNIPGPTVTPERVCRATVTSPIGLRVRQTPSTTSTILKTLAQGDSVIVSTNSGDWLPLLTGGFIASAYVSVRCQ